MSVFYTSQLQTYTGCTCISYGVIPDADGDVNDTAVAGLCINSCNASQQLLILMVMGIFQAFFTSLTWNPSMVVIFRYITLLHI